MKIKQHAVCINNYHTVVQYRLHNIYKAIIYVYYHFVVRVTKLFFFNIAIDLQLLK